MSIIGSAWGQETYSVTAESTITAGAEFQATTSVKLTYGVEGASGWKIETRTPENGDAYGTIWATAGKGAELENNIPNSGTFVKIVPSANGVMEYNVFINTANSKPKVANVINATGEIIAQFTGGTEDKIAGVLEFNVAKDNEYYIYTSGSSALYLGGFTFTPSAGDDTDDPVETSVSTFNISDFNYTTGISARSGLNRTAGGFKFEFTSNNNNEFVKVNNSDRFFFRNGQSGTLAISTDDNNSDCNINKVVLHAVTPSDLSLLTGFSVKDADGNDLTYTTDATAGTITITSAVGTSKININTSDFSCAENNGHLYINKIDVYTDKQVTSEKVTPELSFASAEITTTVGGGVFNALTTTPNNFAVTYSSSNGEVATVDSKSGDVTIVGVGTATITANFGGNDYYNAASSSYTLSVIEPKTTINVVDLNYNNGTSQSNGLDRTLSNFVLTFAGGDGCKYNSPNLVVRNGSGVMKVALTQQNIDAGVTIQRIVFTGTLAAGVEVDAGSIDAGTATWIAPDGGVAEVTFSSTTDNILTFSSMDIVTSKDVQNKEKVTPTITFDPSEHTIYYGEDIANTDLGKFNIPAPTTIPDNFVVKYKLEGDNTTGASIDEPTGVVTLGTPGIVQVVSNFNGKKADDNTKTNDLYKTSTSNVYTLNVVRDYPWTVSGNTLTISTRNGNKRAGGMSTADDSMDDIPGLNVTLTGDIQNRWEILSNAYGKVNPAVENNIPTTGTYLILEPTQSGTLTIRTQALKGSSYYLVDSNGTLVGDAYSHNTTDAAYDFTRELTAGNTYYYYIKGSSAGANLGFSSITYSPYPWTIEGNTLTISTAETVNLTTNTSDNLPGLGVTFNATSERYWEVNENGRAYGKGSPTSFNNNIPQNGTYLEFTPSEDGQVSIDIETFGGTYKLVDENGNVVKSVVKSEIGDFNFESELTANTKYYFYQEYSQNKSLGFYSITYELTQETTKKFNVSDFNYERGAQGIAGVGLNREIGGFTFTYNPSGKYQFVKANGYQNFFFRVNESGTLVIAPDANNSGAKITQVVLKGSFSTNKDQDAIEAITGLTASATEGSCETAIDIANGTLTVTCAGTPAVNITTEALSNAFTVSSIEVTTDRDVTFEKITPSITFDSSEISYAVGSASFVNGLTVNPANFRLAYSITSNGTGSTIKEYTESAGDGVAGTVTIGATIGNETVTAAFAGNDFYNPVEATYTLKVQEETGDVAGKTWDFTTWSTEDIAIVDGDDSTWEYNNNGYHKNKTGTSQGKTDFGLAVMDGLKFTTTGSDQIRIYPNTDGQTDGSIRLQSKNAKIYMPALEAGQTITLTMMTASESSARGMVFSGAGADKLQLIYGAETSKTMNVVTYRVTEDINEEELIMSASTGGLYLYSIKLGYSELYWTDGSNTVTDVAVTAAGETSYTLNSAADASYTITDANGNTSEDVVIDNGKVKVNTFTLGKTHTITATVDGHNATLTLRMVNTASISYEQTTATGTLGFSFVEPVLTKNPEGLNVVKWKSDNPEVATVVADNGEVTLVGVGTTTITAYIEANNYYAYTDASYTLTVNEKPVMVEPWTLSLVVADGKSVAVGSTGHKLTMTAAGTIKAGQVTNAIPGLTLSFGKTGDSDWTVNNTDTHFGDLYVADADPVTLAEESYIPTGGAYLGLEPTVNGVLSLHAAYYKLQGVVVVDKETNTVVAQRRVTDDNHYDDYEFTVPLQADRTYYVYNIGNGKKDAEFQIYDMPVNAITFTPVFLDRIGHVIVKNNEYNITGAQLADDIHDYPTFSNVHAAEGGSVHYHSDSDVIYLDEDGNLVIDGEGTATLQAHVSHTDADGADCHSVAQCTVTYTKSQLKFSGTGYTLASNLVESFTEPTLTLPAALSSSTVTYSVDNGFGIDSNTGNITGISGSGKTATVTATISPENIYFNPTATYTITSATQQVPFEVLEEITVPVGTRAFSLISDDEKGVLIDATSNVVIDLGDSFYGNGDGDKNTWGKLSGMTSSDAGYNNIVQKFFSKNSIISTDPGVVKINNRMQIDAVAEGTATVSMQSNDCTNETGTYSARNIVIKINVVKDTESGYYESVYKGTGSTYRTWNFHNGFDATELSSYDDNYTALGNSTGEAENFITHIPSGHDFWIYDSENNTLKSNTFMTTVEENKIDRNTVAFIANEPMNNLSLTSTATNCFASSEGKINDYRESGTEPTYQYDDDDKNVLTFYTFRNAKNNWEGTSNLNQVSDITFNAQTNMCGITGVDKDEHVTPYRSIQLSGKAAFIRVNDIKPGMWMSVIADNNLNEGVGFVQLASDGAEVQAMGQSLYSGYSDSKDANLTKYPYNRVTNVFPYLKSDGTTVAIENENVPNITNIMVGYPAGMGTLNVGGGEKSPKINNIQRTYGYATFVSPYNIDLTGQTALKAYICDYYGKDNNLVHMVQIKHIPANTPVMLKGYARDMYVLYISEGNKDVDHGISEEVFKKNRLVGAMEDGMMVQPTEEGLHNGAVTTWHNMGLTQNKFLTFTVASPIAKGRAYLRITQEEYEDLYAAHVSASAASTSTKIVFEDTDFDYSSDVTTPTGIENLENVTVTVGDGHYYNLNGVRVNGIPTQKGIYIRNGKKIVVR